MKFYRLASEGCDATFGNGVGAAYYVSSAIKKIYNLGFAEPDPMDPAAQPTV